MAKKGRANMLPRVVVKGLKNGKCLNFLFKNTLLTVDATSGAA